MATDLEQDQDYDLESQRDAEITFGDDSMWDGPGRSEEDATPTNDGDDPAPARERQRDSAGRFKSADGDDDQPAEESADLDSGLDPQVLDAAQRVYGFTPEQLSGFSSTQDLQRALVLADHRLRAQQQQQYQPHGQQPQQGQQQQPPQQDQPGLTDEQLQIDLSGLDEDDPIRQGVEQLTSELNRLRQGYQQVEQYVQHQQQQEAQRRVTTFQNGLRSFLSELDPDLYGQDGSRSAAQEQLIAEVEPQAVAFISAQLNQGADFYSLDLKPFFRMAAQSTHFDKLVEKTTKQKTAERRASIEKRSRFRTSAAQRNHINRATVPSNLDTWDAEGDEELNALLDQIDARAASR